MNRIVEIAGPDEFRLDELIRAVLAARSDPREVIADPHARYFGIAPSERTLLPGDAARLGPTHFADWFKNATGQTLGHNPDPVTEASRA